MQKHKAMVIHCIYGGLGGHASVLFTILSDDMLQAFDHHVLFFGIEEVPAEYIKKCHDLGVPYSYVQKTEGLDIGFQKELFVSIDRLNPDVVMVHGSVIAIPILLGRMLTRRPWSVLVRESQANHQKTIKDWLGSWLAKRYADTVVCLTQEYLDEMEARLKPYGKSGRPIVVHNGVDTDFFYPASSEARGRPLHISMAARIVPLKDHATLLEATRLLVADRGHNDIAVSIAGDGDLKEELERVAVDLGIGDVVTFTGRLSHGRIASLLRETDIYAHCTFGEGMSNSILQAMSTGLPIVASDVHGVSNHLRDGVDGMLVPAKDAEALANMLEMLIESPGLRAELGAKARERAEGELSQRSVVRRYQELFTELIERAVRKKSRPESAPILS